MVEPEIGITEPAPPESWLPTCNASTELSSASRRYSAPNTTWIPSVASGDLMPYTPRSPLTTPL